MQINPSDIDVYLVDSHMWSQPTQKIQITLIIDKFSRRIVGCQITPDEPQSAELKHGGANFVSEQNPY
jgi:hypothetical protein